MAIFRRPIVHHQNVPCPLLIEDLRVGKLLEIDAANETFTGDSATPEALAMLKREYRKGFEVPDKV
jgi:hypothetical protein